MKLPLLTGYEEKDSLFDLADEVLFRLPIEKRVVITAKNKQIADDFAQLLIYRQGTNRIRAINTSESCVVITYNEPSELMFSTDLNLSVKINRKNQDGSTPVK